MIRGPHRMLVAGLCLCHPQTFRKNQHWHVWAGSLGLLPLVQEAAKEAPVDYEQGEMPNLPNSAFLLISALLLVSALLQYLYINIQ